MRWAGLITLVGQLFGADGFIEAPPFLIGALAIGLISGSPDVGHPRQRVAHNLRDENALGDTPARHPDGYRRPGQRAITSPFT
jgi:hypothetical protein